MHELRERPEDFHPPLVVRVDHGPFSLGYEIKREDLVNPETLVAVMRTLVDSVWQASEIERLAALGIGWAKADMQRMMPSQPIEQPRPN